MSQRERGTIARWFDERGFGFVRPDDCMSEDVFVHITGFAGNARPDIGMRVEFEIGEDRGRTKAVNVQVLGANT